MAGANDPRTSVRWRTDEWGPEPTREGKPTCTCGHSWKDHQNTVRKFKPVKGNCLVPPMREWWEPATDARFGCDCRAYAPAKDQYSWEAMLERYQDES